MALIRTSGSAKAAKQTVFKIGGTSSENSASAAAILERKFTAEELSGFTKMTVHINKGTAWGTSPYNTVRGVADSEDYGNLTSIGAYDADLTIPSYTSYLMISCMVTVGTIQGYTEIEVTLS